MGMEKEVGGREIKKKLKEACNSEGGSKERREKHGRMKEEGRKNG